MRSGLFERGPMGLFVAQALTVLLGVTIVILSLANLYLRQHKTDDARKLIIDWLSANEEQHAGSIRKNVAVPESKDSPTRRNQVRVPLLIA